jgi:hypothetical protein
MRSVLPLALLFAATALHAGETRILFAPARTLEAGEVVTVEWEGVPAEVEELEFLLLRQDGKKIRITPQLVPSARSFRWTIPNLPARGAVLVLRAGIDGREITIAASTPFDIRGAARGTRLEFRHGEWWALETRPPAGDVEGMRRVQSEKSEVEFIDPRQSLLGVEIESGAAQPFEVRDVTLVRVDTRCGAPRIVPQRK